MDILQKKTVKELKSILREYKKIHCKPYSRLKKAQMIELIKYHGISEHDIEKTGKIKTQSKPKSKIRSVRAEHEALLKKRTQSRTNSQRTVANADKKMKKKTPKKTETKPKLGSFGSDMNGSLEGQIKDMEDNTMKYAKDYPETIKKIDYIEVSLWSSDLYKTNENEARKIDDRIERLKTKLIKQQRKK